MTKQFIVDQEVEKVPGAYILKDKREVRRKTKIG